MKLSILTGNGSGITPLNSPGGSTRQRSMGRRLLCLAELETSLYITTKSVLREFKLRQGSYILSQTAGA